MPIDKLLQYGFSGYAAGVFVYLYDTIYRRPTMGGNVPSGIYVPSPVTMLIADNELP
jgi:hypothetical protein